ncbi:PEGA domain-containing protein [Bacteroidota bacterium]
MKTSKLFLYLASAIILLFVSCNKEVSTTEPNSPIDIGQIAIQSNPAGAKIFLDRYNTGKTTPDSIKNLSAGDYQILLKRELFFDTTISVNLGVDEQKLLFVDYFANPNNFAQIDCISEPSNALIYLNDSCTNLYTPNSLKFLMPGIYKVKFTYPEHRADSVIYTLRTRDRKLANIELQDTTVWVDYNASNSDYPNAYLTLCLAIDKDNVKWFGTRDKGVVRYDDNEWKVFNTQNSGLLSNTINDVAVDEENTKYFCTNMGLVTYNGIEWREYRYLADIDLTVDIAELITLNSKSDIWLKARSFPSVYQILLHFDGNTWTRIDYLKEVATMAIDKDGKLWCGYDRDLDVPECGYYRGIDVFDGSSWTDMTPLGSLLFRRPIKSLVRDKYGIMWIVSSTDYNGGVYTSDGNNITEIKFYYFKISNIHIADNNNKWISAANGMIKLDPNNGETFFTQDNSGILTTKPQKIATQFNGDVWITTLLRGVIKFKGGNL